MISLPANEPGSPETFTIDQSGRRQGQISVPDDLIDDRIGHLEWDVTEDVPESLFGRVRIAEDKIDALTTHQASQDKDIKTLHTAYWLLLALYIALVSVWVLVP